MNRLGLRQVAINVTSRNQLGGVWRASGDASRPCLPAKGRSGNGASAFSGAATPTMELTALLAVHGEVHRKATITAGCTLGSYVVASDLFIGR